MAEHREHAEVCLAELGLTCHCCIYTACNYEALEGYACKNLQCFLLCLSFSEEYADLSCAAAIYGHVKVTDSDVFAVT